jgi:hypothetical protein
LKKWASLFAKKGTFLIAIFRTLLFTIYTAEWFETSKDLDESILSDPKGSYYALMIDILRRSGRFEEAMEVCENGLANKPDKIIQDIMEFQATLIQKRDMRCYTIGEANKRDN